MSRANDGTDPDNNGLPPVLNGNALYGITGSDDMVKMGPMRF